MNYIDHTIIQRIYTPREKDAHKGDCGRILCIGGSEDYTGAPYLALHASIAMLRSGADIATIAAPKDVAHAINSLSPDVITKKIDCEHFTKQETKQILNIAQAFDCILIGPGLGEQQETFDFVNQIISNIDKPFVIDADAIKAIDFKNISNSVITPHRKELEIMLTNSNITIRDDVELQKYIGSNIVLIKDNIDTIISKDQIFYNNTGNPGMTVGGTGDILAGLTAGFIAQKNSLIDAANGSAYLCGYIGDKLYKEKSYSFIASDFLNEIAPSIKELS